jgi:hypothetical protein
VLSWFFSGIPDRIAGAGVNDEREYVFLMLIITEEKSGMILQEPECRDGVGF